MGDLKVNEVKTDTIKNQAGSFSIETTAMANTPCFSATIGSGLTNQSNNVAIKIPFNTATFNQGGGTFDTSNYRYTPGVAGVYMFGTSVNLKDYNDDNDYQQQNVSIRKKKGVDPVKMVSPTRGKDPVGAVEEAKKYGNVPSNTRLCALWNIYKPKSNRPAVIGSPSTLKPASSKCNPLGLTIRVAISSFNL